jgi:hypothetical protein
VSDRDTTCREGMSVRIVSPTKEPKRAIPQNRFPEEIVSTPIEIPDIFGCFQKCRDFKGFWDRPNGQLKGRSAARWLLWGVFRISVGDSLLEDALGGFGKPPPSASVGIPRLRCLCITCIRAAPGTGNTALSFAPPPPWGQGWRKGGGS